jgi:threonylcarbamoyladenosine tRNA methylthiotransferase MtaB
LWRLRLSSIDSIEADDALFDAIATEHRLMPHFHLSMQHGDDLILKRMKRRHLRDHSIEFCDTVRRLRPDASFGADMIAGFPTETETMFENALSIIDACGLARVHVFPFSPRNGTPAAKMPQLDRTLVKDRAACLRLKAEQAWHAHLAAFAGTVQPVLLEKPGFGRAPDFTPVRLTGHAGAPGDMVATSITGHDGTALTGSAAMAEAAE